MDRTEELREIMERFAATGWEPLATPAHEWLQGKRGNQEELEKGIHAAAKECGGCGCQLDPLYQKVLLYRDLF